MASGLITEYLGQGAIASRPATPDIPAGAIGLYYATDSNEMSAYADGGWIEDVFGTGGALLVANNLSDLANVATAQQNISLEPGVDVLPMSGGTLSGDLSVPDEAYDATAWNGSAEVPTKNAIRDKIESLSGGGYEGGPITAPTTTTLGTWVNQGTSTATDGTGALVMKPQVNNAIHGREMVAPSAPYDLYLKCDIDVLTTVGMNSTFVAAVGFILRDNSDGELIELGVQMERISDAGDEHEVYGALIGRWTNATTNSAYPVVKYNLRAWPWMRVNVTSTTITFYVGRDGKNWLQVGTETISTFVDTVDRVGVYARANTNATEAFATFSYFSTTAPV